jgi:hypothetical protein
VLCDAVQRKYGVSKGTIRMNTSKKIHLLLDAVQSSVFPSLVSEALVTRTLLSMFWLLDKLLTCLDPPLDCRYLSNNHFHGPIPNGLENLTNLRFM